jgi:hypothetical protein
MKKIFSFFAALLFASSMMAADPVVVTSTFTKATAPADSKVTDLEGKVTWSIATEVGEGDPSYTTGKSNSVEAIKFGGSKTVYFSKVEFTTDYFKNYNVTSVKFNVANNGKKTGTLTVKQGETTIGTASEEFGNVWTELTATGTSGKGGSLTVTYEVEQAFYLSSIEVEYEAAQGGETTSNVKTIYCKAAQDWWKTDGAAVGVYAFADGNVKNAAWPGVRMTAVEGETDLWKADIDTAKYEKIIFTRVNASGDIADWGAKTADLTIPADKDLYTITSTAAVWGDPGVTGTWSVYKAGGDDPVVEEPAVIKMHGNFTGEWVTTDAFTLSEDKKTATLKLTLNKGSYEFGMRIGADDNWTSNGVAFTRENKSAAVAAGTGNLTLAADTKGDYTFTWTYATNTLAIDFPEYVETLPVMQIAGAWNVENDAWVKNAMTPAEDKKTASYEVELKAGDYEFKVIKDNKWLTKANEGNAYGLHREWTGVANVKDEATENLKLTADVDGKYTFVWTFANDSLGVVFPEKPAEPAAAVVLPATLDVTNVSFRSEGMPDFVVEEGQDYAGTYFDMGAHDSSNDTLLYAEWNVTIQPIKYNVAVDVYNTNGWTVQLYLLNQAGDTVKALRYKGSSGKSGQFAIGALDLSDLEAGDYKVRARAATAWSAMKLKDVIFTADYKGVSVELPGTLQPAYAELSSGASVANDAIAFKPSTANNEYATWNVSFAKAGKYNVTIDMTATNGHTYGVALLSADGAEQIGAVAEAQAWDTGVKELGAITVPAAGKYVVKLTNATQWSEAVLNSITFAAAAAEPAKFYITGDSALVVNAGLDKAKAWNPDAIKSTETSYKLNLAAGDYKLKVTVDGTWETAKGFDALTTIADGLTADGDGNICFTLTEAGGVNVHYDGEFFFLNGEFYVAPVVVKYYLKNNWDGGEWTWKEMVAQSDGSYLLENVVFGGTGVNINTSASDEGSRYVAAENIPTMDMTIFDMGTLGALDTVAFVYTPSEYNSYNPDEESGLSAYITGKYVPGETPQPVAHTYTVAGNLTDAFGTAWDPANAANDMVKQEDGTYKWEKAELALAAGTVQFKVCEDHAWDVAYPASDYQLAIAEAGEYTITITFNPETKAVDAAATKTGDAVVTVNYYLAGSAKGWEAKAENIFTLNAEAGEGIEEYVIETTLEVGEGLKVLSSTGTWYPEGMGNEYIVDQNHAGTTTIYFRPAGNAEWAAFGGFMYVVPTGTVGFDNTAVDAKAVKVLRDGQVIIIRGEHEYTTMGQMIK